jgi:hypothetical protein
VNGIASAIPNDEILPKSNLASTRLIRPRCAFHLPSRIFRVPTQEASMTYDIPVSQDYLGDAAPEHKSGIVARGDYDDFRVTFEEFKAANDERLARLKKKRGDALLEEKVDRINAALDAQHSWLARHPGLAGEIYAGTMNNVEWLKDYHNLIQVARDEPKTLEELQAKVGLKRPGYNDHHIVEKTWAEYFGFTKSQIDDPSNLASIPRLTHYQITGWYMTGTEEFGGLSPREYLADKSWDERRRVGLLALVRFKVLKP